MEDNKKIKTEEPLLYIHQPEFKKPDLKMQEVFHSVQGQEAEKSMDEAQKKEEGNSSAQLSDSNQKIEEDVKVSTADEKGQKEKTSPNGPKLSQDLGMQPRVFSGMRKVKSFREMTIEERLRYLSSFPISQPPYPCEFITEGAQYQGFVMKYENEQVSIKTPEEIIDIDSKEVKAIRIIR